jgi:hypothetical protein
MSIELKPNNNDITFSEQDFKDHNYRSGSGIGKTRLHKVAVSDLDQGLFETSEIPVGKYRTCWIMKLKREPGKCKLPRGFGQLSGKSI